MYSVISSTPRLKSAELDVSDDEIEDAELMTLRHMAITCVK